VKQRFEYAFIWDLKHPGLRQVMLLLGPNVLAVGITSIAFIVDTAFTSFLPDKTSLCSNGSCTDRLCYWPTGTSGIGIIRAQFLCAKKCAHSAFGQFIWFYSTHWPHTLPIQNTDWQVSHTCHSISRRRCGDDRGRVTLPTTAVALARE